MKITDCSQCCELSEHHEREDGSIHAVVLYMTIDLYPAKPQHISRTSTVNANIRPLHFKRIAHCTSSAIVRFMRNCLGASFEQIQAVTRGTTSEIQPANHANHNSNSSEVSWLSRNVLQR
jgi:hypothetical protein